jgi:Flp pilus assembly protein TadG
MMTIVNKEKTWAGHWIPGSQQGAAAVEFAVVFPLLIMLLFGMIEFGLYLFNRQVITNACREAARYGVVALPARRTNAEIRATAMQYSARYLVTFGDDTLTAEDILLKIEDTDTGDGFDPATSRCLHHGCDLEVRADYTYDFLFLSMIGIDSQDIQVLARMKME